MPKTGKNIFWGLGTVDVGKIDGKRNTKRHVSLHEKGMGSASKVKAQHDITIK